MINLDNKKKLPLALTIYFSLILIIIVIGQYEKLSAVITSVLSVLSPLIIGFALAYLLNPILKLYEKKVFKFIKNKRALRILCILCTYLSLILFLYCLVMLVVPQITKSISDLTQQFGTYINNTLALLDSILESLKAKRIIPENINSKTVIEFVSSQLSTGTSLLKTLLSFLANNLHNFMIIPKNIFVGLFISIYALLAKERIAAQLKKAGSAVLKEETFKRIQHRMSFTHATFGSYFTGVLLDAIFVGILSFLVLVIFGVPYASLVAVLVAVTNVIPVFGPFIGAIPSALIIFISEPKKVIIFIIAILIIQQIDGNIIAPRILGNSTGMSSLAVIIAITVMGSSFGFVGMLIGVPVFAVIISFIKELTDERLTKLGLSTNTADYYPRNSMAEPTSANDHRITITDRIISMFKKLYTKITKKNTKEKDEDK